MSSNKDEIVERMIEKVGENEQPKLNSHRQNFTGQMSMDTRSNFLRILN